MPEKAISHQLSVFSRSVRLLVFETTLSNSIRKGIVGDVWTPPPNRVSTV